MIACYKGHIHIAKYLLSLNADVNRKSVKGNTALHDCAESGSLHILKMLLGHGATMDVDSYGGFVSCLQSIHVKKTVTHRCHVVCQCIIERCVLIDQLK